MKNLVLRRKTAQIRGKIVVRNQFFKNKTPMSSRFLGYVEHDAGNNANMRSFWWVECHEGWDNGRVVFIHPRDQLN